HTRSKRDWSSDVCSSDLTLEPDDLRIGWYYHDRSEDGSTPAATLLRNEGDMISLSIPIAEEDAWGPVSRWFDGTGVRYGDDPDQIGRASCRERGCVSGAE